ncbi:HAMP domain-containing sensor histidine kinase [Nostoc sp. CHAB 5715]|uniref:sensor histidine kinase n=1 Tax=Nostoc sp. CHAB 5715 TaxID=2780400 RepID=UPI001E3F648A|nr:HAMP domain-containing sensor histidine kinase [Nostoc sp. CHAB 5715]MCC5625720.1 HAMP domain-containing histidine kinase [Nostoc sp. CHAB 5715]
MRFTPTTDVVQIHENCCKFKIQVTAVEGADEETVRFKQQIIALESNQPCYRILIVDDKDINRQILVKLLSPLGFEVKEAQNGQEAINIWQQWQFVSIRIQDNGIGMRDDVKQKIFEHLFTTKCVGKGTGLGLAIAHQIVVEKHHGAIAVNSTLGEGTEFVITLPVKGR